MCPLARTFVVCFASVVFIDLWTRQLLSFRKKRGFSLFSFKLWSKFVCAIQSSECSHRFLSLLHALNRLLLYSCLTWLITFSLILLHIRFTVATRCFPASFFVENLSWQFSGINYSIVIEVFFRLLPKGLFRQFIQLFDFEIFISFPPNGLFKAKTILQLFFKSIYTTLSGIDALYLNFVELVFGKVFVCKIVSFVRP